MIAYPTTLGRDPILPATCAARGVLVEAGTAGGRPLSPSGNISHVIVRGLPATRPVEAVPVSGSTSSLGPDTGQHHGGAA